MKSPKELLTEELKKPENKDRTYREFIELLSDKQISDYLINDYVPNMTPVYAYQQFLKECALRLVGITSEFVEHVTYTDLADCVNDYAFGLCKQAGITGIKNDPWIIALLKETARRLERK